MTYKLSFPHKILQPVEEEIKINVIVKLFDLITINYNQFYKM